MKFHAQMGDISPGGLGMPSPYAIAESISQRSSIGGFGAGDVGWRTLAELGLGDPGDAPAHTPPVGNRRLIGETGWKPVGDGAAGSRRRGVRPHGGGGRDTGGGTRRAMTHRTYGRWAGERRRLDERYMSWNVRA